MLQTYLHLLLKISESVARLESLLLIASPDDPSSPELKSLPLKSLGGMGEDGDDRCVLPYRVSLLPNVQLTTGREETAQSISFALQRNTLNFSIMFLKRRPTPDPHLLTRFNGFVSCLFSVLPHEPFCPHSESAAYSQHCHLTLIISSLALLLRWVRASSRKLTRQNAWPI